MTLPYSGFTTAYRHKHHPDKPLPPDPPKALRKEWFLDAQWTDLPVEVEADIKRLWRARELGNDDYMIRKTPAELAESFGLVRRPSGSDQVPRNLAYLLQYLREQGVQDDEYVIIHWWW